MNLRGLATLALTLSALTACEHVASAALGAGANAAIRGAAAKPGVYRIRPTSERKPGSVLAELVRLDSDVDLRLSQTTICGRVEVYEENGVRVREKPIEPAICESTPAEGQLTGAGEHSFPIRKGLITLSREQTRSLGDLRTLLLEGQHVLLHPAQREEVERWSAHGATPQPE
jgi:hypothetical protein